MRPACKEVGMLFLVGLSQDEVYIMQSDMPS